VDTQVKYKVGDFVRVTVDRDVNQPNFPKGTVGTIRQLDDPGESVYPYLVERDDGRYIYMGDDELELVTMTNTPRLGETPEQTAARTAPRRALDTQVGGDHYTRQAIQPFEYSMRNKLDPMQHTVIKYVTRFRDKGGRKDLEKAIHTLQLLIEFEYGAA
jgi:hypothetical protein